MSTSLTSHVTIDEWPDLPAGEAGRGDGPPSSRAAGAQLPFVAVRRQTDDLRRLQVILLSFP